MYQFSYSFGIHNFTTLNLPPRTDLIVGRWGDSVLGMEIIEAAKVYSFKAKVGSDLVITGYDMGSIAIPGWKYKSAATVDVFGENAVPVVSMFQNYNYGNQFFCKHKARVLHPTLGYELFDATVMEIVAYSEPLTGDDLVKANLYFGVPAEITTAIKYVDSSATTSTEAGTKENPYKSVVKAFVSATENDTVYIKPGTYKENTSGYANILFNKALKLHGLGKIVLQSTGTGQVIQLNVAGNIGLKHIVIDGEGNTASGFGTYGLGNTTIDFANLLIKGCTTNLIAFGVKETGIIKNSVIVGDSSKAAQNLSSYISEFNGCYMVNINLKNSANSSLINCQVPNNKFTFLSAYANTTILGGSINHAAIAYLGPQSGSGFTLSAKYVQFRHEDIATLRPQSITCGTASLVSSEIKGCDFESTLTKGSDFILNVGIADVQNNRFKTISTETCFHVYVSGVGTKINYNYSHSNSNQDLQITIGGESQTVGTNDNSELIGNRIIGPYLDNPLAATSLHSVLITSAKNTIIKYNKVSHTSIGIGIKATGETFTSGGYSYNLFEECAKPIVIYGAKGVKVNGNTIKNLSVTSYCGVHAISDPLGPTTENIIIKNNIIQCTNNGSLVIFDAHGAANGCIAENNQLYGGQYLLSDGTNYNNLATANAVNKLLHCVVGDPSLNASLVPATPLIGADLGDTYKTGLGALSAWKSPTTESALVLADQPSGSWQKGAIIQI